MYSKHELNSRYEIMLENYAKTIHVEGLTTLKMAEESIYPAVLSYLKEIATTANELQTLAINCDYLKEDVATINAFAGDLKKEINNLKAALNEYNLSNKDMLTKAKIARDEVFVAMNKVRNVADQLETMIDHKKWPIPTYIDLMFGI